MKKVLTITTAWLITLNVFAQVPEKMSYQAVVRDATNVLVTDQVVSFQISILQNTLTGKAVYVETQAPKTNASGLVSLEIGTGTIISGDFSTIEWANDIYFIQTEIDPDGGTNYTITGTSQLMSVPYALHAKTAESVTVNITETDPIFEASDVSEITKIDIDNWNNHTVDTDTQLSEVQVDDFVANNGYLTAEIDGSTTNEIELPAGGIDGQILQTDGAGNYTWVSQTIHADTDTQLSEAQVDEFTANNGYLTIEVDGSTTNEIELPTGGTDGQILQTDGAGNYTWANQTINTDTDTQLSELQVDEFVADNGYLTAEVDGSITNEIQNLSSVLTQSEDAGGASITNLGNPLGPQDAATKSYVDLLETTVQSLQTALSNLESTLNSYINTWYEDIDGDGYGNSSVYLNEIAPPTGYSLQDGDCNNNLASVYPGAPEIVDAIDNNCDGNVDEATCGDGIVQSPEECDGGSDCTMICTFIDNDGDGSNVNNDCDDNDASRYPGAPEEVDGIDNNCNDMVDEATCGDGIVQSPEECDGTPDCDIWTCTLLDVDGDGSNVNDDCDDNDASRYPGAPEEVDGVDNNCDGNVDEAICGDGILQAGEECDSGGGPGCNADCTAIDSDGDGIPDNGEFPGCENDPNC